MSPLEIALAFMAGVSTLFSPCSFPLFPGYVLYYLGSKLLPKAALGGLACASGIIAVFLVIGVALSLLGNLVSKYMPFLQVVAGVTIVSMGALMVSGRTLMFSLKLRAPKNRGFAGLLLYGIVYGLAAAGCSAPIFFSMLLYAFSLGGILHGAVVFAAYAMGVGLPMIIVSILVSEG